MSKLNKKELNKIEAQFKVPRRGDTWVGIRPHVFLSKRDNKKAVRAQGKALCREYL